MRKSIQVTIMLLVGFTGLNAQPLVDYLIKTAANTHIPWNLNIEINTDNEFEGKSGKRYSVIGVYVEFDVIESNTAIRDTMDWAIKMAKGNGELKTREDSISRVEILQAGAYLMELKHRDEWWLGCLNLIKALQHGDGANKRPYCLFLRYWDKNRKPYYRAKLIKEIPGADFRTMAEAKTAKPVLGDRFVTFYDNYNSWWDKKE